jgi:long-chain fatty acid transport protein
VLPLPFGGVLQDRLALGLGLYFPSGVVNRARAPFPDEPRLALLESRLQVVSLLVAAGARVHRRVSLGIGVLALAALVGQIAITPDAAGRITTVSEEQLVVGYAPVAGVRVLAAPSLQIGLALRGESKSGYDIAIVNSLGPRLPIQIPTLHIAGTAQYDPLQMALEAAWRIRWLTVEGGVTWKHWSAYPNPVQNATPGAPPQPPPGFHDTAVPRLAFEASHVWRSFRVCARAGYFFEWSPSPGSQTVLLDADRHVVTAGGGVEWRGRLTAVQLDLFGQLHVLAGGPHADGEFGVFGASVGVDL